jgi:hypothetical protein
VSCPHSTTPKKEEVFMKSLKTQPTLLALSILAAFYTPAALAAPIVLTPTALFSSSFSTIDNSVELNSDSSATNPVSASSAQSSSNGNTSGSTFARPSGAYAVSTSAYGGAAAFPAYSTAQSNLTFVLANSTTIAQNYFLTLKIYGGNLSTSLYDPAGLTGQEFLRTGYDAKVTRVIDPLNNTRTTLFASSATMDRSAGPTTDLTRSGTTLTGANSEADAEATGQYFWNTDYYTIDLGVVDAGGFAQIDASLEGFSRSNVGAYNFTSCNSGYDCFKGQAGQFYGDPLGGQDTDVFSFDASPVGNNVPEPGSLLLAGAALGAAGLARRRRKVSSTH